MDRTAEKAEVVDAQPEQKPVESTSKQPEQQLVVADQPKETKAMTLRGGRKRWKKDLCHCSGTCKISFRWYHCEQLRHIAIFIPLCSPMNGHPHIMLTQLSQAVAQCVARLAFCRKIGIGTRRLSNVTMTIQTMTMTMTMMKPSVTFGDAGAAVNTSCRVPISTGSCR
jgi:hypothetical protein